MRQLHCNHAWYSGLYTLATRCHTCTAVTLKYTEASSLKILWHSLPPLWIEFLTHACENTTFPQRLLRTVTKKINEIAFTLLMLNVRHNYFQSHRFRFRLHTVWNRLLDNEDILSIIFWNRIFLPKLRLVLRCAISSVFSSPPKSTQKYMCIIQYIYWRYLTFSLVQRCC